MRSQFTHYIIFSVLIISLFIMGFVFFRAPISVSLFPFSDVISIEVYKDGVSRKVIPVSDELNFKIVNWLKRKDIKWNISCDTYAPLVYIKGKNYTLNIIGSYAVLNYGKPNDRWGQVLHCFDKDDKIIKEIQKEIEREQE